ncbi:MAG: hypothetical protein VB106_17350 [Clostridiaceae bacterium]|jgi:hypothetical protein|nr:hypothetical protein [Clostridiaceae bacterium]
MKFDRVQISSINDYQSVRIGSNANASKRKAIAVPKKETFNYVFENAKRGNEMAAVLLDEWEKNCEPKNNNETQIVSMINMAANRIFK